MIISNYYYPFMKAFLTVSILFLFNIITLAQNSIGKIDSTKLNLVFRDSTISELKNSIARIKTDKSTTIGNLWIKGEISGLLSPHVNYYQLEMSLITPLKLDNKDYWGESRSKLEILSADDKIIFKRLKDNEGRIKKFYYNKSLVTKFINNYEVLYNTKIEIDFNKIEFYDNESFGVACSMSELTSQGEVMMELVKKKQLQQLLDWVKAIPALTKAYGVLGIYILTKRGIVLKKEEKRIFDLAKKETIKINTCEGCIYGTQVPLNILLSEKNLKEMYNSLK